PDAPPTASPFAVSFYTLPKHWQFRHQLEQCTPGGNRLPDGDFEQSEQLPVGWRVQQATPEEVEGELRVTTDQPHDGRHCLMIQVRPKVLTDPTAGPAGPPTPVTLLEPTYLAVTSPPVQLPPGSL